MLAHVELFYIELWFGGDQIATRQDLGLADSYVDGDFTFVNPKEGLLNFMLVRFISAFGVFISSIVK